MTTSLHHVENSEYRAQTSPAVDRGFFGAVEVDLLSQIEAIANDVGRGGGVETLLRGVAMTVAQSSPWPMCSVELFDGDDLRLLSGVGVGFGQSAAEVLDAQSFERDAAVNALHSRRMLAIPDVSLAYEYPATRRWAIRTGFRSAIYVPIRLTGCWAVLACCHPEAHEFLQWELSLADTVASLAGIALGTAMRIQSDARAFVPSKNIADTSLQRRVEVQDRLLCLQVEGAALSDFCRAISDLLGLPVLLVDQFQQRLGVAGLPAQEASELAAWLAENNPARNAGGGPVRCADGPWNVVVGSAEDGANRFGSLVVVVPSGKQLSPAGVETLELACVHVTLALLRHRAAIETEMRMRQDFGQALGSLNRTGLELAQLAAVLGIEVGAAHRVMRVHPDGLGAPLSAHEAFEVGELLTNRLAQVDFDAIVAPVGGVDFVVVLRDQEERRGVASPAGIVRSALRDALSALRGAAAAGAAIAIGIGHGRAGVDGLDRSHREAKRALEVARKLDGDEAERHIADVGSYAVLAGVSVTSATDQELFVGRYLEPLMEYDRTNNANLVETLRTYFENVGNVQRTADRLFLHLSTVRYRLKRIEEIAEIDLGAEEDRLCMQLALRLASFPACPAV